MKLLASGAACAGVAALLVAAPLGTGHALAAARLSTGIAGTLDCVGPPPVVNTAARTVTLASDCSITGSVTVQDGYTFLGAGHTLIADYLGAQSTMFPAVLVSGGAANIKDMTISAINTTYYDYANPWDQSMTGILYQDSSGTVDSVTVKNFGVPPPSGNADGPGGNGIIASAHGGARRSVAILHSTITGFQKRGVGFYGNVNGTLMYSTIGPDIATTADPADSEVIATNAVEVGQDLNSASSGGDTTGASAQIRDNTVDMSNDYVSPVPGDSSESTGILSYGAEGALDVVDNAFNYGGTTATISFYSGVDADNSEAIILGNKFSGITTTKDTTVGTLYIDTSSAGAKTYVGYNLYGVTTTNLPEIASLAGPDAPDADTPGGAPPGVHGKELPVAANIPERGISVASHGTTLHVSWPASSPLYYVPVAGYCVLVDDLARQCEPDPVTVNYHIPAAFAPGSTHTVTVWPYVGKNSQAIDKSSNEYAVDPTRAVFTTPFPTAAIRLVKSATPTTYTSAGQVIRYSFRVSNDGGAVLDHVRVIDTLAGLPAISCPGSALPAGRSETCTATYRITAADLATGHVTNYARAEASVEPTGAVMSAASTVTIHAVRPVPVLVPVTG
jgi:uncharacterized repeat protein (TIGR01451 family)